ncbi:hypothetical protein WR25_08091 [Diploscapter pachys]|uniref:Uncharacterized protein n=1 Tax=Diploscapter pachys TaxID=2018661 RepID=A0A2A2L1S0_9BILA|nr:hypothetical protein WR25_08091 [Diploscapter pachys]
MKLLLLAACLHLHSVIAQANRLLSKTTAKDSLLPGANELCEPMPESEQISIQLSTCSELANSQEGIIDDLSRIADCCPQNVRPSPSLPLPPPNMARPAPALPNGPNMQLKPLPSSSLPPITNPPVITSTLPTPPPERPSSASTQTSQASSPSKSSQQSTTLQQLSPATIPSAPSLSSLPAVQHTDPTPQTPTTMHMRPERKFTTKSSTSFSSSKIANLKRRSGIETRDMV